MSSSEDFRRQVNSEMRAGRGQVVDGYRMPPEHEAINAFLRAGAAANTWETTPDGQVTHIAGEPVEGRGGEGR